MVDAGGNWIHGSPENPLYYLAQDAGLNIHEDNFIHPFRLKIFDQARGRNVNPFRILYLLLRAAQVIGRYTNESLTATHSESNLAERIEKEVGRIFGANNKRYFRFLTRTVVDLTAAQ